MSNICHRNSDSRVCLATTIVVGQDFVNVDGQLWAVVGDINTHGDGGLINSQNYIRISGKYIIIVADNANPDDLCPIIGPPHCDPISSSGDSLITVKD
jgi:hypothetical protein